MLGRNLMTGASELSHCFVASAFLLSLDLNAGLADWIYFHVI